MIALVFILSLALAPPVMATTYWASPSGGASTCAAASGESDPGQYRTLSQGISCLSSGDTLRLVAGTYTTVNVGNGIPSGPGSGSYTTIIGAGPSSGSRIAVSSNNHGFSFTSTSSWIKIMGIEVDGQANANLTTNPNFVDAPTNFRLQEGSDAIDAGADLSSEVPTDFAGVSRPQGEAFDIGAFEFEVENGNGGGRNPIEAPRNLSVGRTAASNRSAATGRSPAQ